MSISHPSYHVSLEQLLQGYQWLGLCVLRLRQEAFVVGLLQRGFVLEPVTSPIQSQRLLWWMCRKHGHNIVQRKQRQHFRIVKQRSHYSIEEIEAELQDSKIEAKPQKRGKGLFTNYASQKWGGPDLVSVKRVKRICSPLREFFSRAVIEIFENKELCFCQNLFFFHKLLLQSM